jgi:hypothetical protein
VTLQEMTSTETSLFDDLVPGPVPAALAAD